MFKVLFNQGTKNFTDVKLRLSYVLYDMPLLYAFGILIGETYLSKIINGLLLTIASFKILIPLWKLTLVI